MKVLVVCPTYGRIPYLGRMLASFLASSYGDKQLVILNDDKNVELVCNDWPNVTVVNIGKKILLPQKRNMGVAAVYCDIVMQLDDDDIFLPDKISTHVEAHKNNPSIQYYNNSSAYCTYGDEFILTNSPPHAGSYTKKAWHEHQGYASLTNFGDDVEFIDRLPSKLIDTAAPNYIYNFGYVNYHTSCQSDEDIETIAMKQLVSMNLLNKKFQIVPDWEQYENFQEMIKKFKQTNTAIKVTHIAPGVVTI